MGAVAEKSKYGQYFTQGVIADFMVSLITHSRESRVLEPSCGKGVFLDALKRRGYADLSAYEIDATLSSRHSFVRYQSFLSVPLCERYEVVIGNPPYIRWKNIEPELKLELASNLLWNRYFNSLCDYLYIFILKSVEHLIEGGELIFICTEYWLNSTHSATLRDYMCQNGYFTDIYHFKEASLFEGVSASFVIFRYVKSRDSQPSLKLHRYNKNRGLPTFFELLSGSCFCTEIIPQFREGERWILAGAMVQEKMVAFERSCIRRESDSLFGQELYRLGDYCDIANGMVSGLDKAFQLNSEVSLTASEQAVLVDVLKAKDLAPYKAKGRTPYIFIKEPVSAEDFDEKYPNFAQHFAPHLEALSKRYSYNRKIPYWEFVFPRNLHHFEKNEARIFVPCKERISNKRYFRFCYADASCYATQDVTALFRRAECRESLEYILAYLNSPRVFDWLLLNGIIKGDIVEFSETPISQIPFRAINWGNEREVMAHDRITQLVCAYLGDASPSYINEINEILDTLFL